MNRPDGRPRPSLKTLPDIAEILERFRNPKAPFPFPTVWSRCCRVSRDQFLREVWRLKHTPETNLVEVHVARLRAKLHEHRLSWLIATHPDGGYSLEQEGVAGEFTFGLR